MNIVDILKGSSLRGMISDMEIAEIAEEISSEIDEIIEAATDRNESTDEADDLKDEINSLERKISKLEKNSVPTKTLNDIMTLEWVRENWESMHQLSNMNKSGKEIVKTLQSGTTIDAVAVATDMLTREIKRVKDHKRIVLVGRAASGKDHMRKTLEDKGFKYAVSYTTRPKRDGEVHGIDYFFITNEKFEEMIEQNEFYEHVSFNGWHYGTTNEQFYNDDIFIMTPHGISHIDPKDRKNTFIMYLDMKLGVRQRRLAQRSDADTVERRLEADDKDFAEFRDFDIRITNHDF
jgi:guanylate kinase